MTAAIHRRFGLPASLPAALKKRIKTADRISARLEAVQIAGFDETEARKLFPVPGEQILTRLKIDLSPPAKVRAAFLEQFSAIMRALDQTGNSDEKGKY